ncbi:hypothetical protein LSUE1_G005233 [Lachnellula suecica]|uniref:Ubiquitin-like domain-containing protein n=1 Tax=Lachnellula suecica TaxID=602035 RepID=A0A8T9C7S2_9HELO|nr:hypothetical protein LSUE1_G005233 [Lachnellula suecica]
MSEASAVPTSADAITGRDGEPGALSFTLIVVSPSVGVASPLNFHLLPASTTVRQLKAKIRDVLPSKPVDDSQRLIHRGRMLGRDTETMLEVFGQDTIKTQESQTLHLVLRPVDGVPSTPAAAAVPITRPQAIPPNPLLPQTRPQSTPTVPGHGMQAQQPLPGFQQVQQHQVLHQTEQVHNIIAQRLQQLQNETQRLQREMGAIEQRHRAAVAVAGGQQGAPMANPLGAQASFQLPQPHFGLRPPQAMPPSVQNFIAQQQRNRASEGRNGAQDSANSSGRASPSVHRPDHTTTYTREGFGANGERWQVTVNETTSTFPVQQPHHHHPGHHHHLPANPVVDIQAVLRNADRYLAAQNVQAAQDNMQRSVSNPPPSTSTQAGTSTQTPAAPQLSTTGSATTPATTNTSPSASTILNPPTEANSQGTSTAVPIADAQPMVYILSSSQGPRALLVSNSDTFFTPRQSSRRRRQDLPATNQGQAGGPIGLPEYRNRAANWPVRRNQRNQNGDPLEQINAPHGNPPEGALAARIGPAIWLAIRLIAVIWFFASGNTSWTRWFLVCGIAFVVFLVNIGVLNGFGEQFWGPIRRHLENLIPLAGPEAALVPAANAAIPQAGVGAPPAPPAGNEQARGGRRGEPDPAEVAARLIEEHRQRNGGWLMGQFRRAEHAALLFVASLVPGVGERHIAHREAEANAAEAERQRLLDEAAAAANPETAAEGIATESQTENTEENQPAQVDQAQEQGADAPAPAPAPPLIDI